MTKGNGDIDSVYESLIKEVVADIGSGLVGLHIKAYSWATCSLS